MTYARMIPLADTIYLPAIRHNAMQAFAVLCDFEEVETHEGVILRILPRASAPSDVVDELLSYLLTGSLETHLLEELHAR